ncbi:MAG: thioredoxin domain-containing protein [Phycisphaerales bacterium]|nr:thioredoxin domain-containing protein [Phycisphaerales bacterium]GIK18892.1 MAG: thioredoxin domain-containing protein [Planctomycetota bacterium]
MPVHTERADARRNRLAGESSPYLLQHAGNPVDWLPWGREAFDEAKRRDVPIFLSIGYSTCHWCHVMERESFENPSIAAMLNERFVCVKVDREERPEVDNLYMTATQLFTGQGGWPMSIFLEPERLHPFWCGTYIPAEPHPALGARPDFPRVIEGIATAWRTQREGVMEQAERLAAAVSEQLARADAPVPVGRGEVEGATAALLRLFDPVNAGFGGAPKFPQPSLLLFLLGVRDMAGDDETRAAIDHAVRATLDRMMAGGIHDHLAGGFHRYAVDAHWTVPHFEKMLYDNAMLASVYARAGSAYGDEVYRSVARSTLDYILRELTGPRGEFLSAQDADASGHEGAAHVWTRDQFSALLESGDLAFAARVFGLDRGPNFRDPHHPDNPPANVLRLDDRPDRLARSLGMEMAEFDGRFVRVRERLIAARRRRQQPATDDKVIAEWNGHAIVAMVDGAALLGDPRFADAARRAARFILDAMSDADGSLARSWRGGVRGPQGSLEDYASAIVALARMHALDAKSGAETRWLDAARTLLARAEGEFASPDGGYFDVAAGRDDLFVRVRSTWDGALPTGSSVMLHALISLADATGNKRYIDRALACVRSLSATIARAPAACIHATAALARLLAAGVTEAVATATNVVESCDVRDASAADGAAAQTRADFSPLAVFTSVERIEIGPGRPAELPLLVRVAEGWHVAAADAGDSVLPFRVHVVGGGGIEAYADYPPGVKLATGSETLSAYEGEFALRVAVEQTGPVRGRPLLAITCQACNDTACLAPTTLELDVAIDWQN